MKPKTAMNELVDYFDKQLALLEPLAKKDKSVLILIELTKKHQAKAIELLDTELVAMRHAWNDCMFDAFPNYMRYFYEPKNDIRQNTNRND